ncbi:MAG: helix-turn-helix domain-containing protein [Chloroflexota bacterium]|nr:helix-turn-helix domain-containing protein [Dehalococcoidia bacterium]MDW8253265.1 helix-turn-helix domain-containing protein [Chloroflexota bacterium]
MSPSDDPALAPDESSELAPEASSHHRASAGESHPSRPRHHRTGKLRVGDIRRRIAYERREALDTREPLAIRFAGERYEVLSEVLADYSDDARIDPWAVTVGVSQAAKMLGFNVREVRSLIRLGRLPARKQKNEWRIPLDAVL